jgi:hypothetical protein
MNQLCDTLILIIALAVITIASLIVNALAQSTPTPQPAPSPPAVGPPAPPYGPSLSPFRIGTLVLLYVIAILMLILAALLWLSYYVTLPLLEAFLFASLGLFASSLVRTRGSGLLAAGGIRLVFWVASYVVGQIFSTALSFLTMPLALLPEMPVWFLDLLNEPAVALIFIALAALVILAITVGLQMGVVIGLLSWTSSRAGRLPFGSL